MEKIIKFLKSLFSKSEKNKSSSVQSIYANSKVITGENNNLYDNSINTNFEINNYNCSESHQTRKRIYSFSADKWNNIILKWIPFIHLCISLVIIYFQENVILMLFSMIFFSLVVLYRSYQIPKQYNSHFLFVLNIYSIFIIYPFYKLLLYLMQKSTLFRFYFIPETQIDFDLIPTLLTIPESLLSKILFLFSTFMLLFQITRNTIDQWIISNYGEAEEPLTIKRIRSYILKPLIISIITILIQILIPILITIFVTIVIKPLANFL